MVITLKVYEWKPNRLLRKFITTSELSFELNQTILFVEVISVSDSVFSTANCAFVPRNLSSTFENTMEIENVTMDEGNAVGEFVGDRVGRREDAVGRAEGRDGVKLLAIEGSYDGISVGFAVSRVGFDDVGFDEGGIALVGIAVGAVGVVDG